MNRFVLAVSALLALAVPAVAAAAPTVFATTLSGPNENPANSSPGTGSSTVFYDATAHTLRVFINFSGLTAGTTASHIHCCVAPPGNAGVATQTPTFAGFPLGVTAGVYDNTFDLTLASSWNAAFIIANGGTPAGAEAAFAAGLAAGRTYVNVHTTAFPGGEIRGFLGQPPSAPDVSSAIPTLGEWALVALAAMIALAAAAAMRRRR